MKVQARIAIDGGGVYAVEVDPDELKAQISGGDARLLEFSDPAGYTTLIPREKVLMVQFGPGIPSPQEQEAEQQAQFQQMQQQYQQMQQQYQQMLANMPNGEQPQASFGDRVKAGWQQFQDQFMPAQTQFPPQQQFPQQGQQQSPFPQQQPQFPQQQQGSNPLRW